ncbi:sigma-70 family RNA polymerase sigma factor [Candidatus Peregrinibacteria bacterium]|nr:sigma-70 family RNA polymerase sigma factor [Candidatus Peregrinibacteria bacterium]
METSDIQKYVSSSQNGDSDAFGKLYDAFIQPIFRYMHFRVGPEEAEDLTELVFLKTWENIRKYRSEEGNFSSWIFRIAHNLVVDHYRAKRQNAELTEDIPDVRIEANTLRRVHQKLDQEVLWKALHEAKDQYRQILILKFINGFSNEEISLIMGRSQAALRILQFRALRSLRRILENMGVSDVEQ